MENQINETIERKIEEKPSSQANRVFTDAYALQIAEQVLTNVERVQSKTVPKSFDVKKIRNLLGEYKAATGREDEEFLQLEFRVLQELHFWRAALARRDETIKTFHLRRFYEANSAGITNQILSALGCFYRSLTPSFEVRSKYDFVLTQLFSAKLADGSRYVRYDAKELHSRLQQFNVAWTGIEYDWSDAAALRSRAEAVAVFDALRNEAEDFLSLEDLLKRNFFNRVRRHKQYLGEIFFAPEVTAASIQCNVAVGNKFARLVQEENESFRGSLESEYGSLDVLNLVLEEEAHYSIALLNQINPEFELANNNAGCAVSPEIFADKRKAADVEDFQADAEREEPDNFGDEENHDVPAQNFETQIDGFEENADCREEMAESENISEETSIESEISSEKTLKIDPALLPVLDEINKPEPAEDVLREYLKSAAASPVVGTLDLCLFLGDAEDVENDLKREALRLIFIAEDYRNRVRNKPENLPSDLEIKSLKSEIQIAIDNLRAAIRTLEGEDRKERTANLLAVVDNLFQARLRLITAYSKYSNTQEKKRVLLEQAPEKTPTVQPYVKKEDAQPSKVETKSAKKPPKTNRGLLALTVLTVIFGIGYFFYPAEGEPAETVKVETGNVKNLDAKSLPGGEYFLVARVSNNSLIAVVEKSWSEATIENKRQILQSLLDHGNKHQYKAVLLFDSKGEIVGRAAGREILTK